MKAWVISETPALGARVSEALARCDVGASVNEVAITEQTLSRGDFRSAELVLLAVNRLFPPHLEIVRRVRSATQSTIAVLSTIPNHSSVLQAIRAGADDFLDLSGDVCNELQLLIARRRGESSSLGSEKRLITVIPSFDQSDANLLAVNVSVAFARGTGSCELLDFQLQGGDLAQLLSLTPRHTLVDLLSQKAEVDIAMFEQAVCPHSSGLRLVAGPRMYCGIGQAHSKSLKRIIELARSTGAPVVVNAENAVQAHEVGALARSDRVVLTTRLDLVSLSRAKQHVTYLLDRSVLPKAVCVVAMGTGRRAELSPKDANRVLGDVDFACVPEDTTATLMSVNVGEPMVIQSPKSETSRAFYQLANTLLDDAAAPNADAPRPRLFSFSGRRAAKTAAAYLQARLGSPTR